MTPEEQKEYLAMQDKVKQLEDDHAQATARMSELEAENKKLLETNQRYFVRLTAQAKAEPEQPAKKPAQDDTPSYNSIVNFLLKGDK